MGWVFARKGGVQEGHKGGKRQTALEEGNAGILFSCKYLLLFKFFAVVAQLVRSMYVRLVPKGLIVFGF